ncbi:hypothetical protein HWV62_27403 [Athelia sp. TMB]|nr:hypothetical protein HWV62_27403 [Athelia sp. TMB]
MPRARKSNIPAASRSTTRGTPSTPVSPDFSNKSSVQPTPDTSDIDEDEPKAKERPKRATRSISAAKKRPAVTEDESNGSAEEASAPKKRRAVTRTAFVEIPAKKATRVTVGKKPAPVKTKSKGKCKARQSPELDVEELPEGAIVSENDELEFDEQASVQESDISESEFEASDEESDVAPASAARKSPRKRALPDSDFELDNDSEDEQIMLDAAIQESLQSARQTRNATAAVGSSSSGPRISTNPAAALRAAAAERRLARSNQDIEINESLLDDELTALSSSDDEPLAKKQAAKAKGKKAVTVRDTSKVMITSFSEKRAQTRDKRRADNNAKRANKQEEKELMKQLGRKLTHAEKATIALYKHHPDLKDVWGDVEENIAVVKPTKAEQPANLKVTLLPFQQESLHWMREQEKGIWSGGMLADEMGMGKTIQIIALLVSDRQKPNLVVAPTVAVMQWRNEIEAHTSGLKVLVWHGASRESDIEELQKYDVVLTTFSVLESCFRKQQSGFKRRGQIIKETSPLHEINWKRIVLDEAHNIKERSTNTAKAAFELQSKYKWCLSGTPLQNRVGELYSLVRFLGGDPFSYYFCKRCDCKSLHWKFSDKRTCDDCGHSPMQHTCFWNNEILTPIQKNGMSGPGRTAFRKLRILLDRMMLRRTKLERADDLGLPPRTVIVRKDFFSPEEKELYLSLFSDAKRKFSTYVDGGTLLNNYSNIFSLLTRMRQMACHPDLVLKSKTNAGTFTTEEQQETTVCRICNDIAEDAIRSQCRHIFDRECIRQYLEAALEDSPECPVCHLPLTIDLEGPALELEENTIARQGILGRLNIETWRSSTKIEALVEELSNLRLQDASTKSIVFSQFVNFLDLIAFRLQRAGFAVCRLEGTMSPQARNATIQHFMNNVEVPVFLVSLKAGGVALNLTEASRVYLMDSWWNPAVEYQAMDRIHRLGQHRPVQAIKLVVEDSIESRIVQLQEKKSAMVDATLSTDDSAMGRLTPEDLSFLFRL